MRQLLKLALFASTLAIGTALPAQIVRSGSGAGTTAARDAFRADLGGGLVAGANGSFGGVRREINWDGVPDAFAAPNNLPANFFNVNSPRGVVFSTPGTGFQVSANPGVFIPLFGNIDPTYPVTFTAFSPQRIFTALDSNIVDVNFFVPGTNLAASVRGFGAIFTDVDLPNATSIEFFGPGNVSLGTFFAPPVVGNQTVSFLGVDYVAPIVTRVRITNGNTALAAGRPDLGGNPFDVVAMDDFLYGEPFRARVPEPASWAMMIAGFGLLGWRTRRRLALA